LAQAEAFGCRVEVVSYSTSDVAGSRNIPAIGQLCLPAPAMRVDMIDRTFVEWHCATTYDTVARKLTLTAGQMVEDIF
jgi:hypothetical protein